MLDVRQSEHRCAEMTRIRRYERPSDHDLRERALRVVSPAILRTHTLASSPGVHSDD